jgi:hypothetical protein
MSRRPFITFEDFSKAKQNYDQILVVHVSNAFSYLALLQCNPVEHPIVDIWEDLDTLRFLEHGEYPPQVTSSQRDRIHNGPNAIHGGTSTSFDAYHKAT